MAKVLMVIDSDFRFTEVGMGGFPDFTFVALLNALTSQGHQITKAHRNTDTSADMQNFNFATSDDLLKYDLIWMLGRAGRNTPSPPTTGPGIGDDEIRAIARFMAAGGGVFATGDHDSIGAEMCGHIPRVRAMRTWFGSGDTAAPASTNTLPRNTPALGVTRVDTTQRSPGSDYAADATLVYFENQSDIHPQPITPQSTPAHPILRRGDGTSIVIYPDHMHEGNTLGQVLGYDYNQTLSFSGESFVEFPTVAGNQEMPQVVAKGQTLHQHVKTAFDNAVLDPALANVTAVNTLSVYEGRNVGVGRIVTGSTFHHYIDINLTGDSNINDAIHAGSEERAGADTRKGHGYNDAPATFNDIKTAFGNITVWLARPRPAIQLILERSTFSQDEAIANSNFDGAILVIVDGLKPNQFPGGGVTSLAPGAFQPSWAPSITFAEPAGLQITPTAVDSDDHSEYPNLADRLQRLTFTYRVQVTSPAAFMFADPVSHNVTVNASLTSAAVSSALTDSAQITLVKGANPFMLDLANNNQTAWLSSDVKVFPVVAGTAGLVANATRQQAIDYVTTRVNAMTDAEFDAFNPDEEGSALSLGPQTTGTHHNVYNFAFARVRVNSAPLGTTGLRVFFRIVPSPTTASLTYHEAAGVPLGSYLETGGGNTIALPGQNGAGTEWWSFPCFATARAATTGAQSDSLNTTRDFPTPTNAGTMFFGALLDTNLPDAANDYLPLVPGVGSRVPLSTLLMGQHQCIVAQIRYPGTPIPDGATPFTSDKLSQRNLAFSDIMNPGLDASRMALHTFEIEATPNPIGNGNPPDELLLEWHREPPDGTEVRLEIPSWNADAVVELADRFYPRHEIRALDAHTIALPGSGIRYVPIPASHIRQTGVISVQFPLGVKKRQRFDVSVHQVTTRGRQANAPAPKARQISREEAARLLNIQGGADAVKRGVFNLGDNQVLITDLKVIDGSGDHAVLVQHPDPAAVAKAQKASGRWRETIGAFQLGIPVSAKADMLPQYLQLLSVMRWRAEWLRPNSRWYLTFNRYVELIAEKVRALGGDPYSVPPTPGGDIPLPGAGKDHDGDYDKDNDEDGCMGCLGWIFGRRRRNRRP